MTLLGLTLSLQGVLKALQKHPIASKILLFGLYCVSLPSAYYISITLGWGVQGLWIGYGIGLFTVFVLYGITYALTSWQQVFSLVEMQKKLKDKELETIVSQAQLEEEVPDDLCVL